MSLYVLMRLFETSPDRYDTAMQLLTLGRIRRVYDKSASHISRGSKVLDIGCGTGALAIRAAQQGAYVWAMDTNPAMLEVGQRRAEDGGVCTQIQWRTKGVAELDDEAPCSFDVVTSGLCFSELTEDELAFTLPQVKRVMKSGGKLIVIDEARPITLLRRVAYFLVRLPVVVVTYVLTQQTTRPISGLYNKLVSAGFDVECVDRPAFGGLTTWVAKAP